MEKKSFVEVGEQEVCIEFKLGFKCRAKINLKSLHPSIPIAFKVQTSSPNKFLVNPPSGLIPPLSLTSFQVILKPQSHLPSSFPRSASDRFLLKTALAPDLNTTEAQQHSNSINMWFSSRTHVTHDTKLKVVYVGSFLLHHAITGGDINAVKYILKRQKSAVAQLSHHDSLSLLEAATASRNTDILNLLIEAGLKPDTQAQLPNYSTGMKPKADSKSETRKVRDRKDEEAIMMSKGWTPIHLAATLDHNDMLSMLIEDAKGRWGLDCRDKEGRTPLHLATSKGNVKCVRLLIEAGADKNAKSNDGHTALFRAAANGDCNMVSLLLEIGADPNIATDDRHCSPLDVARDKGHKEIVEILERGELVLTAARRGDIKCLELLLKKGVGVKHCDQYGFTALHSAAIKGHEDAVLMLAEFGMELECRDFEGHTPLHVAVESGSIDAVEVLIDKGADLNATSKRGATPLYMAKTMGYKDISQVLLDRGASPSSCLASSSSLSSA